MRNTTLRKKVELYGAKIIHISDSNYYTYDSIRVSEANEVPINSYIWVTSFDIQTALKP